MEGKSQEEAAKSPEGARIEEYDPNSTFYLKIKLIANPKKARKDVRCFNIEKVLDSVLISYEDLVRSIVDKYPPGYLEVPHVQYYDDALKTFPEVKCDQDLMSMFEKHQKAKVVYMFVAYCDPSEMYEPITEWIFEEHEQANMNTEEMEDDSYLRNPLPENEFVGVDEEGMYLQIVPTDNMVVCLDKGKDMADDGDGGGDGHEDDDVDGEGDVAGDGAEDGDGDGNGDGDGDGDGDEDGDGSEDIEVDEELAGYGKDHTPNVDYDKLDPPMTVGSMYPNMKEFKLALCQHAIKHQYEFDIEKSSPSRYRVHCSRRDKDNCPWRLHASTIQDARTVMVKKNPAAHQCASSRRSKRVKNATKFWICERVKDWLIEDATLGANELVRKLKEHHKVSIPYHRVHDGQKLALKELYGDWDSSFDNLFRFKSQVEISCPDSIIEIDHYEIDGQIRFRRFFFAMKPCIDGFLSGCRPYLAVDSTFLTGKFKGQLASATAVDGHKWMYPVCVGVFDSETSDNWIWFMQMLKKAIGSPRGLAICTDAGQSVMSGVAKVFPEAEHRECMFHLVMNFKRKFHGKVFDDHLWPAAYSWNQYLFDKHWVEMEKAKPAATAYLRKCHNKLWSRSQFLTICKVDYVTNNLAESFNNWVKEHKSMNLDDFMDKIRQMIMIKWNQRRKISRQLGGFILPHIVKMLNEKSRELNLEVVECSEDVGEIIALGGSGFRFVVNLNDRTCSCRQWQVSGIPCKHAIAFITAKTNSSLESFVDLYYSVWKFRIAYEQLIPAMPDKSQWPKPTHGFFMHPPLLTTVAGRPQVERFKGNADKKGFKRQHKCPICLDYGHHWHNCKKSKPEDIEAMKLIRGQPKKRTSKAKSAQSSIVPIEHEAPQASMSFPPSQNLEPANKKKGKKT